MTQNLLFDQQAYPSEAAARDVALDTVLEHAGDDWRTRAESLLGTLADELTGEDVRLACERAGIRPHHHNAWGAFISALVREEKLTPTGEYRAMKASGSHARKTAVYRRAAP